MTKDLFYRVSITADTAAYDLSQDLSSFTIEEDASKPNLLTVHVSDPFKVFSHALQEGMEIEVELGTTEDHSVIFRGRIHKVQSNFPQDEVPTLRLLAHDRSMAMGLRKRNRPWTDMQLSGIVSEIAGEYFDDGNVIVGLKGDPEFKGNGIRQQDETDLAFLLRLAATYGCETFVTANDEGDALHFEAQYSIMKSEPEVTLYHGRSGVSNRLLAFEANSDVSSIQLPRVLSGIDYESGEPTEVTSTSVEEVGTTEDRFLDENLTALRERYPAKSEQLERLLSAAAPVQQRLREELGNAEREPISTFVTEDDLRVRSENQFSTSIHGMRASGSTVGNQRIRAQANIHIADVGGRFSGVWYLSQVRHVLNGQGYQTEFQCQR